MKYLFFIAWAKAREKLIADKTDFKRMINSANIQEAFKILQDTDYALFATNKDPSLFEEVFQAEKMTLKKMLEKMGLDRNVLKFLYLNDEIFNFRIILKEKLFGIKPKTVGIEEAVNLRDDYGKELEKMKKLKVKTPAELDDLLTKIYFERMIEAAKKMKEKEILSFFKSYKDILVTFSTYKEDNKKQEIEGKLIELEKKFIQEAERKTEGLKPFFAFFFRKWQVEKFLRAIFSAKELGLVPQEIHKLIEEIRIL